MRLLIAIALAGCYDAEVADCQFTCNSGSECPSGLSCIAEFCQAGPTNTCGAAIDAPGSGCPAAPDQCGTPFQFSTGGCGVLCTDNERQWSEAQGQCGNQGWQLGILDVPERLAEIPNTSSRFWVGAELMTTWQWLDGSAVDVAAWDGGSEPVGGEPCATYDGQKRHLVNDTGCDNNQLFICTITP